MDSASGVIQMSLTPSDEERIIRVVCVCGGWLEWWVVVITNITNIEVITAIAAVGDGRATIAQL